MVPMQAETDRDSLQLQSLLQYTRRTSSMHAWEASMYIYIYMLSTVTARIRGRRLRLKENETRCVYYTLLVLCILWNLGHNARINVCLTLAHTNTLFWTLFTSGHSVNLFLSLASYSICNVYVFCPSIPADGKHLTVYAEFLFEWRN